MRIPLHVKNPPWDFYLSNKFKARVEESRGLGGQSAKVAKAAKDCKNRRLKCWEEAADGIYSSQCYERIRGRMSQQQGDSDSDSDHGLAIWEIEREFKRSKGDGEVGTE